MSCFDELRATGLESLAQTLEARGREAIRLKTMPMEEEDFIVGQSKIGGAPHLPQDMEWPSWRGERLYFLAQISLKNLPDCEAKRLLPDSGMLYFFHAGHEAWGFDPEDAGAFRTIYIPDGVPLAPRDPDEDREGPFYPCAVEFSVEVEYPLNLDLLESAGILKDIPPEEQEKLSDILAGDHDMDEDENYNEDDFDGDDEDLEDDFDEEPRHKLFGWPDLLQGDIFEECQLASNGVSGRNNEGVVPEEAAALQGGVPDWMLLFQLDGEDEDGMMWSELGTLYFCIRKDDLQARNFDRAWAVLQCC